MIQVELTVSDNIEKALIRLLKGTVPVISTDKLADSMSSTSDWVLLDSREFTEFEISRLPNAKWVGHSDFTMCRVSGLPKDANLVVYCSIGVRSEIVAEKLIGLGFSNVWNLYGGIFAWANEHRPLINSNQKPTQVVHGYDQNWEKLVNNPKYSYLNSKHL